MNMKKAILSLLLVLVAYTGAIAQDIMVQGTVVSATDGEPRIGATVMSEATKKGVATDIDGNFSLQAPAGSKLRVSYIGYEPASVKAAAQLTIKLSESANTLSDVVVVGYSTQKKVDVTGAITSVNVDEIEKQNENNPIKAMQGRVPGMNITADGAPPAVRPRCASAVSVLSTTTILSTSSTACRPRAACTSSIPATSRASRC